MIATASYFQWHGDNNAADQLEEENIKQFLQMSNMLGRGQVRQSQPQARTEVHRSGTTNRRPLRIVIPKDNVEERQRFQEGKDQEEYPLQPMGKEAHG